MKIHYETPASVPAPWKMIADIRIEGDTATLKLEYPDREDLEAEDMLEEGLPVEPVYDLTAPVNEKWKHHLHQLMQEAKKHDRPTAGLIMFNDQKCIPSETESEHLINEMIQLFFEAESLEAPLKIALSLDGNIHHLEVSFLRRNARLSNRDKEMRIEWSEWPSFSEPLFQYLYDYEKAAKKPPSKGRHVTLGDDLWLNLNTADDRQAEVKKQAIVKRWMNRMI